MFTIYGEVPLRAFEDCRQRIEKERIEDIPIRYRLMGNDSEALPLFSADTYTSSMDLAWRLTARKQFPEWASVLVGSQSSGRGQFRRKWHSPPGNVYGSLRLPALGPLWSPLISLLPAESMYSVLAGLGLTPAIKWPNDLLVGGKKVGGILVEERSGIVIVGLGLNLTSAPQYHELRHPLAPEAGCLREFGITPTPGEIWKSFVHDTQTRIRQAVRIGRPETFVEELTPHLAYIGERILLDAHGMAEQPVIFQGVDANGGIKVQTTNGERIFRSGSIYPMI